MSMLDTLAEQHIREADARGELSNLPGAGQPLALDDDPFVPSELRMAYRIPKNAGMVPPEVEALRDIADLERLLQESGCEDERRKAVRRLDCLLARLDRRPGSAGTRDTIAYRDRLVERFDR
jgi:hypothetical protein